MSDRICFLLHKKSATRPEVKAAVKAVKKSGVKLQVRIPWSDKEKRVLVREACEAGVKRIIAGGGDGTINGVVNALVREGKKSGRAEMGVMPLGTANDFARGIGLPVDDLTECLRLACTAPAVKIDVGKMNQRYFINVASLGFGAEVTAATPIDMKKALGGAAYTLMGMATALKFKPYALRFKVPGKETLEGQMIVAAVGNSRYAGGGFDVAPKASITDGLLDFAVVTHDDQFSLAVAAKELKDAYDENNQAVHCVQVAEFTLESEQELQCNLDGEPVQSRKMKFKVLPRHLAVAMPEIAGLDTVRR